MTLLLSIPPAASHRLLSFWDSLDNGPAHTPRRNSADGCSSSPVVDCAAQDSNSDVSKNMGSDGSQTSQEELDRFFRDVFAPCGDKIPQVRTITYIY